MMLLAYLLYGKRVALYASLIFCLLPSGSEAVFWISGASYVFQAFFSLLVINLYFLFRTTGERHFFLASAVVYLAALIFVQTPWLFTVPFMIVALDIFQGQRVNYLASLKHWKSYGIYYIFAVGYWLLVMSGRFATRVTGLVTDYYYDPSQSTSLIFRLPYSVYKAVELYLLPVRLSFFHEEALTRSVYNFMIGVTVAIFLLLIYLVYKKSRYAGLMLAILASILPVLSPVQVAWFAAERYLYLGGAFLAMILSLLIIKIDYRQRIKNLAGYLTIFLLVLYSMRLITRAADFKSSKALWTATQRTAPTSYRVYNNLGDVYTKEQNWDLALASFGRAIELAPDYADAIHNLGYTYLLMGDLENAKKYLLESYEKDGQLYQALEKLGQIELAQGNVDKAKEYFTEVSRINPDFKY
ncbi:tetratricopeptide repeat protein [Patescibacteria group bacterium]|nr:tetratricopeptide repeat protein [Patescibacteria group bacterium]